jgi:ABC-type antimicrobial peptide transport system ATPase subunit
LVLILISWGVSPLEVTAVEGIPNEVNSGQDVANDLLRQFGLETDYYSMSYTTKIFTKEYIERVSIQERSCSGNICSWHIFKIVCSPWLAGYMGSHLVLEFHHLLHTLKADKNFTLIMVSHDLPVVADIAARILVLDEGEIIEDAPARTLLAAPGHPRTRQLVDAGISLGPV